MLTLASDFALAAAVDKASLLLLVLLGLPLRALRWTLKGFGVACPLCIAVSSFLPRFCWCQHFVICCVIINLLCTVVPTTITISIAIAIVAVSIAVTIVVVPVAVAVVPITIAIAIVVVSIAIAIVAIRTLNINDGIHGEE